MSVPVHCQCGKTFDAQPEHAGHKVRCPACGAMLIIPGEPWSAYDVFISHSKDDEATADAVCAKLEAKGIRCWIAPRDITPGMEWGEAIIDGISECRVLVLVFSAHSNASRQVVREVERAVSKGLVMVPFRIEDVPMSKSLEYFLSSPHWFDALTLPLEAHLERLVATLEALLAAEHPRPVPAQAGDGHAIAADIMTGITTKRLTSLATRRSTILLCGAIAVTLIITVAMLWWANTNSGAGSEQLIPQAEAPAVPCDSKVPPSEANDTTSFAVQFDVHFQRRDQQGSFHRLTADLLPLCSGDRVQIHAQFSQPRYAVVTAVSASGDVVVLYPGDGTKLNAPVSEIHIPPGRDAWLPLEPPEGTETMLLLASKDSLGETQVLQSELVSLAPPPRLSEPGLLVFDDRGLRLLQPGGGSRDLGKRTVHSDKGFIEKLLEIAEGKWEHIRIIAFPHTPPTPLPD